MQQEAVPPSKRNRQHSSAGQLGPLLCWAVVFADIGSSIYYVPGILYGRVGALAGFFVLLTMSVFVLLTLKYAEVSARFPEGGGVVTVAAQAMNSWVGALGGMFILVSYFLTAAISCLSAIQYFSVVLPAIGPIVLEITIVVLLLLGLLNWVGISESAKVSLVGALIALLLVVITIGVTSPLLTLLSTILQQDQASDPVLATQLISLLGGHWGDVILQTEVAVSASLILVFASNTAVIGAYHVFMALSRMEFFPEFILNRNTFRGTPHWSIAFATGIPIAVLLLVRGNINILGDMYAFGLLGAFTVTCIGLDIIRFRERRANRVLVSQRVDGRGENGYKSAGPGREFQHFRSTEQGSRSLNGNGALSAEAFTGQALVTVASLLRRRMSGLWQRLDFWLGVLTTLLVMLAWSISIASQPLATAFGCSVAGAGMAVAYINYVRGRSPVVIPYLEGRMPDSLLAVLTAGDEHNDAIINAAINNARGNPVVFLYLAQPRARRVGRLWEVVDPYLEDQPAKDTLKLAALRARKARVAPRFVYRQQSLEAAARLWQIVHTRDVVLSAAHAAQFEEINPDRIRYEFTPQGKIAHLLKRW